ncbi:MAG TPA: glycosyltransferase family 4 protein [Thermoanaerobaculia bacterium]|jgi:glycosyltransferase involved in cell wall biosynthesis
MNFSFISSNRTWGGSEELWSATAAALAESGHAVTVFKSRVDEAEPRIQRLRELAADIRDLTRIAKLPTKVFLGVQLVSYPLSYLHEAVALRLGLATSKKPDLAIVSQGGNHDGELMADACRRKGLPYVLICQKATDLYWPTDGRMANIRKLYREARAIYFVAEHNLRLTEEQLGMSLPHARVVRNPFLVPWERRSDWPDQNVRIRLACLGRLYPKEKGQDILLRVLARDHWRERQVSVTFYGDGLQREGLEQMARYLGLTSVTFAGFVRDVAAVWNDHHGLVLPSRCEGLPLVLVEAMLSGRVPIVTDVAGSGEVVENDVTGFLAAAATEDALDEAMERAWQRRGEWRAIGEAAAERIRTLVPPDPAQELAALLLKVAAR